MEVIWYHLNFKKGEVKYTLKSGLHIHRITVRMQVKLRIDSVCTILSLSSNTYIIYLRIKLGDKP